MNLLNIGGFDPRDGSYYTYIETYGGGQGAFHDRDGMDGVQNHMTNTRNAPVEAIEAAYPLRVLRYGDRVGGAYYRPDGQQLTLIGASSPFDGIEDADVEVDRTPDATDELRMVSRFCQRFPSEEAAGLWRGYTGVYDCSPDLQPVLGPVPGIEGLHVATGFSGHGFKLSPITGQLIAEKIVDGRTTLVDINLFSPGRFASGRLIDSPHSYSVPTHG